MTYIVCISITNDIEVESKFEATLCDSYLSGMSLVTSNPAHIWIVFSLFSLVTRNAMQRKKNKIPRKKMWLAWWNFWNLYADRSTSTCFLQNVPNIKDYHMSHWQALTTWRLEWTPSNVINSLKQTTNPKLEICSTQTFIASKGLSKYWCCTVANTWGLP